MGPTRTALTPTDLMTMPDLDGNSVYELSDGELIVVGRAGGRHERAKTQVAKALTTWGVKYGLGEAMFETMFSLGEQTARIPDVSVLLAEKYKRVPNEYVPIPFGPDLAVEVISNSESARDAEKKVAEYFSAGVGEVWQVYPDQKLVRVRRPEGLKDYSGDTILRSEILPGFEVSVKSFFEE